MAFLTTTAQETVDDLVASAINSSRLPISQITYTNQNLVGFMQEEQQTKIIPMFKKIREDYWLANYDQTITAAVTTYGMPPRAAGGALRNVVFLDTSGNEIPCPHLDPDQINTPSYMSVRPSWQGQGHYIQNDQIVLWPNNVSMAGMQLRQRYERRPNALTLIANCAQITAVNVGAQTITFAAACPFATGSTVDVISNVGQHSSKFDDLLISAGGLTATITISGTTPFTSTVAVGMWVCPAGLTCVPQAPDEAYPIYVARCLIRIAAGMQNQNLAKVAADMAADALAEVTTIITPRVAGSPKKFVNRNRVGGPFGAPYYR